MRTTNRAFSESDEQIVAGSREKRTAEEKLADKAMGGRLRRACAATGTTISDVARAFGVSEATVARMVTGEISMRARHVALLPDSVYAEFLGILAGERDLTVVSLPEADGATDTVAIEWTEKQAAAFTTVLRAVLDGRFDRAEGAAVVETGMSFARHVLGWVELGRIAQREGVVGVPTRRTSSTETKAAR